jgi:hypothetical protein
VVLDPRRGLNDDMTGADGAEPAPRMLRRPAEAPTPLGHVANAGVVQSVRRALAGAPPGGSLRATARRWAGRISGRSNRRLLLTLAATTDVIAAHCDQMVDRIVALEAATADLAGVLGEEVTQLRAEVSHLRRIVASPDPSHDG